jgi:hypothetical protein
LLTQLKVNSKIIGALKKQYHTEIFGLVMDSKHLNHIDLQSKHHVNNPKTFWDDLLEVVMLIWQCHSKELMLLNVLPKHTTKATTNPHGSNRHRSNYLLVIKQCIAST